MLVICTKKISWKSFRKIWLQQKNNFIFATQNKLVNMLRDQAHINTKWFSPIGYNYCGACVSTNWVLSQNEYAAPPISGAFYCPDFIDWEKLISLIDFENVLWKIKTKLSKTKTTNAGATIHIHSTMSFRVLAFATPGNGVTNDL